MSLPSSAPPSNQPPVQQEVRPPTQEERKYYREQYANFGNAAASLNTQYSSLRKEAQQAEKAYRQAQNDLMSYPSKIEERKQTLEKIEKMYESGQISYTQYRDMIYNPRVELSYMEEKVWEAQRAIAYYESANFEQRLNDLLYQANYMREISLQYERAARGDAPPPDPSQLQIYGNFNLAPPPEPPAPVQTQEVEQVTEQTKEPETQVSSGPDLSKLTPEQLSTYEAFKVGGPATAEAYLKTILGQTPSKEEELQKQAEQKVMFEAFANVNKELQQTPGGGTVTTAKIVQEAQKLLEGKYAEGVPVTDKELQSDVTNVLYARFKAEQIAEGLSQGELSAFKLEDADVKSLEQFGATGAKEIQQVASDFADAKKVEAKLNQAIEQVNAGKPLSVEITEQDIKTLENAGVFDARSIVEQVKYAAGQGGNSDDGIYAPAAARMGVGILSHNVYEKKDDYGNVIGTIAIAPVDLPAIYGSRYPTPSGNPLEDFGKGALAVGENMLNAFKTIPIALEDTFNPAARLRQSEFEKSIKFSPEPEGDVMSAYIEAYIESVKTGKPLKDTGFTGELERIYQDMMYNPAYAAGALTASAVSWLFPAGKVAGVAKSAAKTAITGAKNIIPEVERRIAQIALQGDVRASTRAAIEAARPETSIYRYFPDLERLKHDDVTWGPAFENIMRYQSDLSKSRAIQTLESVDKLKPRLVEETGAIKQYELGLVIESDVTKIPDATPKVSSKKTTIPEGVTVPVAEKIPIISHTIDPLPFKPFEPKGVSPLTHALDMSAAAKEQAEILEKISPDLSELPVVKSLTSPKMLQEISYNPMTGKLEGLFEGSEPRITTIFRPSTSRGIMITNVPDPLTGRMIMRRINLGREADVARELGSMEVPRLVDIARRTARTNLPETLPENIMALRGQFTGIYRSEPPLHTYDTYQFRSKRINLGESTPSVYELAYSSLVRSDDPILRKLTPQADMRLADLYSEKAPDLLSALKKQDYEARVQRLIDNYSLEHISRVVGRKITSPSELRPLDLEKFWETRTKFSEMSIEDFNKMLGIVEKESRRTRRATEAAETESRRSSQEGGSGGGSGVRAQSGEGEMISLTEKQEKALDELAGIKPKKKAVSPEGDPYGMGIAAGIAGAGAAGKAAASSGYDIVQYPDVMAQDVKEFMDSFSKVDVPQMKDFSQVSLGPSGMGANVEVGLQGLLGSTSGSNVKIGDITGTIPTVDLGLDKILDSMTDVGVDVGTGTEFGTGFGSITDSKIDSGTMQDVDTKIGESFDFPMPDPTVPGFDLDVPPIRVPDIAIDIEIKPPPTVRPPKMPWPDYFDSGKKRKKGSGKSIEYSERFWNVAPIEDLLFGSDDRR